MKAKWVNCLGKRFFRLKLQFVAAVAVSLIVSSLAVYIMLVAADYLMREHFVTSGKYNQNEIDAIFLEVERLIEDGELTIENTEPLQRILSDYEHLDFSWYFIDTNTSDDHLFDHLFDINGDLATRFIEGDNYFLALSILDRNYVSTFDRVTDWILLSFIPIFIACISVFAGRKQKHLREIDNGLAILAGGNLDHKISVHGNDEIASVTKNINHMSHALKCQIEQQKAAEKAKDELVVNISHDLRTPLTSITGFLMLFKEVEDKNSELANQYIDVALNKSTEMSNLIEQLFEYVLLSNNQMRLNFQKTNMTRVIEQGVFEFKSLLEEDGFDVIEDIDNKSVYANLDVKQFMRVGSNLIQNIRKYATKKKPILIEGKIKQNEYVVKMSNGISEGIEIDQDVFDRYFTSNRTRENSLGLGLAISREIIHLHNGQIKAEIKDGYFSIIITLPTTF